MTLAYLPKEATTRLEERVESFLRKHKKDFEEIVASYRHEVTLYEEEQRQMKKERKLENQKAYRDFLRKKNPRFHTPVLDRLVFSIKQSGEIHDPNWSEYIHSYESVDDVRSTYDDEEKESELCITLLPKDGEEDPLDLLWFTATVIQGFEIGCDKVYFEEPEEKSVGCSLSSREESSSEGIDMALVIDIACTLIEEYLSDLSYCREDYFRSYFHSRKLEELSDPSSLHISQTTLDAFVIPQPIDKLIISNEAIPFKNMKGIRFRL